MLRVLCISEDAQIDDDWPQVTWHLVTLQVLWLESRVLELELHGEQAAPAEANAGHCQALTQELGCKAWVQGQSDHHRHQVTMSTIGPGCMQAKQGSSRSTVRLRLALSYRHSPRTSRPLRSSSRSWGTA